MLAWVCVVLAAVALLADAVIDGRKSLVWGPAIDLPELDLPVRYLFVQLVDENGFNVTRPSKNSLVVGWTTPNCRLKRQTIDRSDGSYVVRFRLYDSCAQVELSLSTSDGKRIAQSPYTIRKSSGRPLFAEHCDCGRLPSTDEWLTTVKCPTSFAQLDQDLAPWNASSVDFQQILNYSHQRWTGPDQRYSAAVCHYRIVDNEIYRKCYGEHVGFRMFSDEILTSLARKMRLPNVEFLMNLGDWPLVDVKRESQSVPMLSWCGSDSTIDIIFPTYELTESTVKMMDRLSLDVQSAQGDNNDEWADKLDKAVFRGRDSRKERLDLVLMSRKRPDLIDAGITRFFFFNDEKHKYEPTVQQLPFADFFKYRYVISVDGTVAAYRTPFLLAGDSLILKQESPFYEHFYHDLQPNVHFLPLKRDLSDVVEQISWARAHPEQVRQIISNARQFVHDQLQPKHIYCYHVLLLKRYAQLLINTPIEPNEDMEPVSKAAHEYYGQCTCDALKDEL